MPRLSIDSRRDPKLARHTVDFGTLKYTFPCLFKLSSNMLLLNIQIGNVIIVGVVITKLEQNTMKCEAIMFPGSRFLTFQVKFLNVFPK